MGYEDLHCMACLDICKDNKAAGDLPPKKMRMDGQTVGCFRSGTLKKKSIPLHNNI